MNHLTILSSFLVLAAAAVAVLLVIACKGSLSVIYTLTLSGFYLALVSVWSVVLEMGYSSTQFLILDRSALFYMTFVIAAGAFAAIAVKQFVENTKKIAESLFFLLVATLGGSILVTTNHFAMFLLGLRLLSLPIYVLLAQNTSRIYAAMKFFVFGEVFFAVFLFGVALIYFKTGTLHISKAFFELSIPYDPPQFVLALMVLALACLALQKMARAKRKSILS